jgi:carboxyl-terminal processing protease
MLASLDAQSELLDVQDFGILTGTDIRGAKGGIGLELESAAEGARIIGAIEGAPAASADVAAGDVLTAVDDVDLKGFPLNDIVRRLRGQSDHR